jgi:nucleoid DNA-binding protein
LTKKEIVDSLYNRKELSNLKKSDISLVVNLFLETVLQEVTKGNKIDLRGFGIFSLQEKKGRQIFSPIAQKNIDVPPRFNVVFKSSKTNQSTGD